MNILILGLGQSLRGDDAAGLEAVRRWQERFPDTAARLHVVYAGLPGLSLLELLEGMQAVILVDAVHAASPPGTLLRLDMEDLAAFTPGSASAHGWGVAETLQVGLSLYSWLAEMQVVVFGIVGKNFDLGASLSAELNIALDSAVLAIEKEVRNLLSKSKQEIGVEMVP